MGQGEGADLVRLTSHGRTLLIVLGLGTCLACSALFLCATAGFYGTTFDTMSQALSASRTLADPDSFYPCRSLNGEGSDDSVSVLLLWGLLPLLPWRLWQPGKAPGRGEAALFHSLSIPALLFHFGIATCANAPLTLLAGRNLALFGCLSGCLLAAAVYVWPGGSQQ